MRLSSRKTEDLVIILMNQKAYAQLGVLAPLAGYACIAISILLSPWFRWETNALSDLGHSVKSEVAPIYNGGLLLAGFLLMLYSVGALGRYAKWTSYFLTISAFTLQLVATFDEVYGPPHLLASVFFFVSLIPAQLSYSLEKRSLLAALGLAVVSVSWLLFFGRMYRVGVAVPVTVSVLAVFPWLLSSAVETYRGRGERSNISKSGASDRNE
jgi:hypothetical membrane protein